MSVVCLSCGQENRQEARFCDTCGAPLQQAPAATREERKIVTVLFCDIVGSTARADGADPEDVRAALSVFHARVRLELERFGGTVEKFIGDAVMAVFGAPVVHEDDAERAVRAAFAIRDWAADESIEVRIAVNSGEALVSVSARPEAGEAMVAGDVVNVAARLQSAAPVNGILVGESTRLATERSIEYGESRPIEAKGKAEPILAAEAVQARARFGVDLTQAGRVALVGRVRELELLRGALTRVREEHAPQLLTLVGVPGIGKSRLVRELFEVVEEDQELISWRQGRSLPYGEGVTYWALAEMVKAQAGILESDAAEDVQTKLQRAVTAVVQGEDEARWVESNLRPLMGLGEDADQRGDTRAEAFAAWRRFFEALADQGPLVLVFEDLHWADDGLLDFVDHLVEWASGVPMQLVCTARPELLARRPGWGGGKLNATTVSLPPLSSDETARLIHALLDQAVLPAEVQTTLLERAGGNPLYAEEFARITTARGAGADELPLPESIQGLIAARIDALSTDEKSTLEGAAVVGKVFWTGSVAELGAADRDAVEAALHALERKEFVQRERRSSVEGENQYAFRHALVRDVAYGQIPRARRAELHGLAAGWIESLGRPEEHAELLAHHYLSALELARAAGRDTAALSERARPALREAGARAFALNAARPAIRFFEAALQLWPVGDPERAELLLQLGRAMEQVDVASAEETLISARDDLLAHDRSGLAAEADVLLADVVWRRGDADATRAHLEHAAVLVEAADPSPSKAAVLGQMSRFHMLGGRLDPAIRFGREALAMANALGLDDVRAEALNNIGVARTASGDRGGIVDLEESVAILERRGSPEVLRSYNNLVYMLIEVGELERADELCRRQLELADRFGYREWQIWAHDKRMNLSYEFGRWDEALRIANSELERIEGGAPHYLEAAFRAFRCFIALARGDRGGAVRDSELGLESGRRAGDAQIVQPMLAIRCLVLLQVGDVEGARQCADELVEQWLEGVAGSYAIAVVFSEAMLGLDRADEFIALYEQPSSPWIEGAIALASRDFVRAAETFARVGSRPAEASARSRAAEALLAAGRRADAEEQLGRALEFWRSVGATAYLREREALLAAAS